MKKTRWIVLLLLVLFGLVLATGCSGSDSGQTTQSAGEVKEGQVTVFRAPT